MARYVLAIVCAAILVVLLLYLFYWNRLFAMLLGFLLRLPLWNQDGDSVWIELGAVHLSLVGGRILFKDLRYHSSNQTIKIVKGQLSWRYWIRMPAEEEDLSHARVIGEDAYPKQSGNLACRIHVSLQGLEWLMYNRTAAYDNIISRMQTDIPCTPAPTPAGGLGEEGVRKTLSRNSLLRESSLLGRPGSLMSSVYKRTPAFVKKGIEWLKRQMPKLDPKDLLPISLEATRGAITIGNASTPNLLVAEFSRAEGTFGVVEARSRYDLHKDVLNIKFQNATLHYVENDAYDAPMVEIGRKTHDHVHTSHPSSSRPASYLSYAAFQRLWQHLKLRKFSYAASHNRSLFSRRRKEQKRLEKDTPLGAEFATSEYAIERKILEAPTLELLYYADAVGLVPPAVPGQPNVESLDPFDIGNGDLPPEWGVDLVIKGGSIRYGPWADRQRAILQHSFFPPMYSDTPPTPRLRPGDTRKWTGLKIFVELRDGVNLQIPFREASKNWMWDGEAREVNRPRRREAASIHVRAGDSSTISYIVPMEPSSKGYNSVLEVHLDTVTVTSSLNDIRLVTAETCRIRSDLPSPLKWNGQRQWTFAISLRQPVLYLLRDHINLFTDLGKDWSSGPPGDYNLFTPMIYVVDLDLQHYELNLYVNDHNIIDKPLIREENALVTLQGTHLAAGVHMPFTKYQPEANTISFWVEAPDASVGLALPRWNIASLYPTPARSTIGRVGMLNLSGSYRYFADVREDHVDNLQLDLAIHDIVYICFGWTIRFIMILRENYFGSFTHFSTLNEYLNKRKSGKDVGDPVHQRYRPGQSNSMQVTLGIQVHDGLMILPAGLPGYEKHHADMAQQDLGPCLMLGIPSLQLFLRSNDYYMEMSLNVETITGRLNEHCVTEKLFAQKVRGVTKERIVLDNLAIVAHRLFGPQPLTSTYVCIWEICLGDVKAVVNAHDVRLLSAVGSAFGFNFSDPLNAPAKEYAIPSDPDVTFLKVQVETVNVVWLVDGTAAELSLPRGIRFDHNDLAGKTHRGVSSIRLPQAIVRSMVSSRTKRGEWFETAEAQIDANIDIYSAPLGWQESAERQREFIAKQDELTERARILYAPSNPMEAHTLPSGRGALDNDFYLPQIRIPTMAPTSGEVRRADKLSALREEVSESDMEPLPDAIRDARLAQSRPKSMSNGMPDDQDNLSVGDESDDDGLTEGGWTSDGEDGDDAEFSESWPPIHHYRTLCRLYEGNFVARPSQWPLSPFTLRRDIARLRGGFDDESLDIGESPTTVAIPPWASLGTDGSNGAGVTTHRVLSKDGLNVWLTPMALPGVLDLLADLSSNPLSPELRFDALMMKYIDRCKAPRNAPPKLNLFDVKLAKVHLRCLQMVSTDPGQAIAEKSPPSGAPMVTAISIHLRSLQVRGREFSRAGRKERPALASSFESFTASLVPKHSVRASYKSRSDEECLVAVGPTSVIFHQKSLAVILGEVLARTGHIGPRFVLATAAVWAEYLSKLFLVQKQYAAHVPALDQQVIHEVLKYSRQRAVVDPLSTIQPSYLVQSGLPDQVRRSITFKFFVYLRFCLRYLEDHERQAIDELQPDAQQSITMDDILAVLENQWVNMGGEEDLSDLAQHSLLQELFPSLKGQHSPTPSISAIDAHALPLDVIHFRLAGFHSVLLHPVHGMQSDLQCGPINFFLRIQPASYWQPSIWGGGKSMSLQAKDRSSMLRSALTISLDEVSSTVYPHAVQFLQGVVQDWKYHGPRILRSAQHAQVATSGSSAPPKRTDARHSIPPALYSMDVICSLRSFTFTAAADKLIVKFITSNLAYSSSTMVKHAATQGRSSWGDWSTNHSLVFGAISFQACTGGMTDAKQVILASVVFKDGKNNATYSQEAQSSTNIRVLVGLGKLQLEFPRSALRLYRFVEEWRADYLPGLESAVRALLSDLRSAPNTASPVPVTTSRSSRAVIFQLQLSVSAIQITLQVMHGTWLSLGANRLIASVSNDHRHRGTLLFGLQMGPPVFTISRTRRTTEPASNTSIKVELPAFTVRGHRDETGIQGLALVEAFEFTVRPTDWDTLLSVQQRSGQDFNNLIQIIEQNRQNRPQKPSHGEPPSSLKVTGAVKMKGFRIGLEGLSSTLFLECQDISGALGNQEQSLWHIKLSDLALSLASRGTGSNRERRSAFVTVDFEVNMSPKSSRTHAQHLQVTVAKVHAVMQPTSIGELGDFIDHLQAEVLIRQEQRAADLLEFKEKTVSLMRSLDIKIGENQKPKRRNSDEGSSAPPSWLDIYMVTLVVKNIGVAFPLSLAKDLQMPRSGSQDESAVRAFLFSVRSLEFGTQLGENGQASMKGFSFQFVPRFRQAVPNDFQGETHRTRNRLLYPEVVAQVRSERAGGSRLVRVQADINGFVLDLDSTIPDYISSLLDVYRQGKARMERLASGLPHSPMEAEQATSTEQKYSALPTSNILGSMTFTSGKVRLHSRDTGSGSSKARPISALLYGRPDDANAAEDFNLPSLSVWAEFRATPALHKLANTNKPSEPSILIFKTTVHSSQNTLRPSLLPFISELVANVDKHMRTTSSRPPTASPAHPHSLLPSVSSDEVPVRIAEPVSSMKISFSLRIDQSKLQLTCRPDANVIAGLHWDSGGFIINIAPGARRISFSGVVGGLTIALKHGFLSEDCVKLDARNLNFSMAFAKLEPQAGKVLSSISVVVDTEFAGGVRFSRFQDVLCFKAVWLDRIPVLNARAPSALDHPAISHASTTPSISQSGPKQELTTALLLRLRHAQLDVDLGQSITSIKLGLDNMVFRTKLTEPLSELSLSIGKFSVVASGNLAGEIEMPDFQFQTVRRNSMHEKRMLDLSMTSGIFTMKLDSEYHELIRYRAEPLSVYIYDDWSRIAGMVPNEDPRVLLNFVVQGTDVLVIMNVGTVPKLVSYVNKFRMNLEGQKEGASRESQAFRVANAPKPDNPLSAVANAMFKSARSRIKELDTGISYAIGQHMSLKLKRLQLVVFPRSMRDSELAQFVGDDVHARLDRQIQSEHEPARRDLQLSFSAITISKLSHLRHTLVPKDENQATLDSRQWLAAVAGHSLEAIIFSLPSMDMDMRSAETADGGRRVLRYDFKSGFRKEGVQDAEDIYISLNMSLYAWLTGLRKAFAREMEQVKAAAEVRLGPGASQGSAAGAALRKKDGGASAGADDKPESSKPVRPRRMRGSLSMPHYKAGQHAPSVGEVLASPTSPLSLPGKSRPGSTSPPNAGSPTSPVAATMLPLPSGEPAAPAPASAKKSAGLVFEPGNRRIERLTMRQLGEATPDVMHPFFMKKAGFSLEDSLPQYVHEYATLPTEEIMKALLKLYSKQLTRAVEVPASDKGL